MTPSDLDKLAEFCGLLVDDENPMLCESIRGHWFDWIPRTDWNPLDNPEHFMRVLMKFVVVEGNGILSSTIGVLALASGGRYSGTKRFTHGNEEEWRAAFLAAVLELIGEEGW